jgi:hypothetical protein
LAESKNASVVRKHRGHEQIPKYFAQRINAFYQKTFNAWLKLPRPCLFATAVVSPKGKIVKRYRHEDVKTPLECLAQLYDKNLLQMNPGVTLLALQAQARSLAATQAMQRAMGSLCDSFDKAKQRA